MNAFWKIQSRNMSFLPVIASVSIFAMLISCGAKTEIYKASFRIKNSTLSSLNSPVIMYDLRLDNDESKRSIAFEAIPSSSTSSVVSAPIIWYHENIPIDAGAFFVTEMHLTFNDGNPKDYLVFSGKPYGNQGASYEGSFLKKNHTYEIVVDSSSATLIDLN